MCGDIAKVCRSSELDEQLVCRLIAEYLYHDGQIEAADVMCKVCIHHVLDCKFLDTDSNDVCMQEANLDLGPTYRECFVELHQILKALKAHDMHPALEYVL